MNILARILITAILVLVIAKLLPGVTVDSFSTSIVVAIVLAFLNLIVKPVLVILTLPVTILTLGLFLLIINGLMIVLCTRIVGGFAVHSFFTAFLFSIILSIAQSLIFSSSK